MHGQGRMILAHLCDEPKGLKTGMCMVCPYSIVPCLVSICTSRVHESLEVKYQISLISVSGVSSFRYCKCSHSKDQCWVISFIFVAPSTANISGEPFTRIH
jgi:hypothetical protein